MYRCHLTIFLVKMVYGLFTRSGLLCLGDESKTQMSTVYSSVRFLLQDAVKDDESRRVITT